MITGNRQKIPTVLPFSGFITEAKGNSRSSQYVIYANVVPRLQSFKGRCPQRFGHPLLILLQRSGFRGKIENVLEVDSAKYRNLFHYLKKKVYLEGFTKQDKTTLRKFVKKFEYDSKLESMFYDLLRGQREG